MHSQIYSGFSLISAILRNYRVHSGREWIHSRPLGNIVFFYSIGQKKSL